MCSKGKADGFNYPFAHSRPIRTSRSRSIDDKKLEEVLTKTGDHSTGLHSLEQPSNG